MISRLGRGLRLLALCAAVGVLGFGASSAAGGASSTEVAPDPGWRWPLAPPVNVAAPFLAPATRYSAGHRGIDLVAASGTPVLAPTDGVVSFAGTVVDRPLVTIDHGDGVLVSLEPVLATAAEGEPVARGQPIGSVAAGGHCADGCLHLGVRVYGEYVSPLVFITGLPRAVLLPLGR
ncbi:M23 family metallopeptidase [Leifsonia flava]|uniref:M23 family metallopeptidase n=1 Tax=Orlajensenia leifsoniae TaxID=2561933 RepID=A0A4Y9R747_9MICO|nr:M23 family metallopeptidase [Leifsonia flava]TFV99336.1 M23 family metallopeptidase [Leifsonia flava]